MRQGSTLLALLYRRPLRLSSSRWKRTSPQSTRPGPWMADLLADLPNLEHIACFNDSCLLATRRVLSQGKVRLRSFSASLLPSSLPAARFCFAGTAAERRGFRCFRAPGARGRCRSQNAAALNSLPYSRRVDGQSAISGGQWTESCLLDTPSKRHYLRPGLSP